MKGNRKTQFAVAALAVAVAALAVVAALMLGLWYFTRPQAQEGAKAVVVEVVHGDESAKEFTYHTDLEYLGELLLAEKLVEGRRAPLACSSPRWTGRPPRTVCGSGGASPKTASRRRPERTPSPSPTATTLS